MEVVQMTEVFLRPESSSDCLAMDDSHPPSSSQDDSRPLGSPVFLPPTNHKNSVEQPNSLAFAWNIYYHLPQDKNWTMESYVPIYENICCLNSLITINEAISDNIIKYCMLFVMKKGITPMWEDKANRDGGCFSFKVINKVVPDVWRTLMYLVCGNSLTKNAAHMQLVNGITISPKKNFSIIKVWMRDCSLQDPEIMETIPNLIKTGCVFRKHEPEF
jgi:Eukaryotic initiation factor 4E